MGRKSGIVAQEKRIRQALISAALACLALPWNSALSDEVWRGLTVAPESGCAACDSDEYPYPQSVEQKIARQLGAVYGPYTGTCFGSTRETDNEHIVAASEAHDSGLSAKDRETQARFARDLRHSCASYRSNTLFL